MTTKASTKAKRRFERELADCKNINELVWIYTEFAQDASITCDDLYSLIRNYKARRVDFEQAGDKYSRATKPDFRK